MIIILEISFCFLWQNLFVLAVYRTHGSAILEWWNSGIMGFNPPSADKGLIPRPLGRSYFPLDTPLPAAG